MKSQSEPIARKANAEDKVTGRFWEGRFGCQALLSEKSILAAMAYVDLNPVRAKIAGNIATSRYTSVKMRNQQLRKNPERANHQLMPLVGVRSFNLPDISVADYIELVDFTGRELHPGKRGKIEVSEPNALTKLGLDKKSLSDARQRYRFGVLACCWGIGRIDRQSQGNQPTRAVWDWLCSDFEQDLGWLFNMIYGGIE